MSGGVDSAVAAARAVDAGHEVVGVHLALSRMPGTLRTGSRGCCTIEDAMDARRVADRLGIPFYVWDFSERFRDDVIEAASERAAADALRAATRDGDVVARLGGDEFLVVGPLPPGSRAEAEAFAARVPAR